MSATATVEQSVVAGTPDGGVPARRAVIRWAWRLFRREWRQQMLVLALIVVALAATVVGAAVATNTPPPAGAGFGTAQDMATLPGGPHLAGQIGVLHSLTRQVGSTPLWLAVVEVLVGVALFVVIASTAGYVLAFWNFRLTFISTSTARFGS